MKMNLIFAIEFWEVAGLAGIAAVVFMGIGVGYVLIQGWLHNRRLNRMRKKTDEARQREKQIGARLKSLR